MSKITSSDLIQAGIKPGEIFGKCLKCSSIDEAIALWEEHKLSQRKTSKQIRMLPGSLWHWLCTNDCFSDMCSRERVGAIASNSEKRRWIENGRIFFNSPYKYEAFECVGFVFNELSPNESVTLSNEA